MNDTATNERFDRLTNLDISTHYRGREYCFMRSSFLAAFAYWVVSQSPYDVPEITPALQAFKDYVGEIIKEGKAKMFTYESLKDVVNEDVFERIPAIEVLNHPKIEGARNGEIMFTSRFHQPKPDYDFIDLGALSRNVFYMLLREQITQD